MKTTRTHNRIGATVKRHHTTAAASPSSAKSEPQSDEPWGETRVVKTMWPPQPGTRRLRGEHGAKLVCVRYRHDRAGHYRYTTVELMVDHAPVRHRDDDRTWVLVRLPRYDADLRALVKAAGGEWQPDVLMWLLTRRAAIALGLGLGMTPAERARSQRRSR